MFLDSFEQLRKLRAFRAATYSYGTRQKGGCSSKPLEVLPSLLPLGDVQSAAQLPGQAAQPLLGAPACLPPLNKKELRNAALAYALMLCAGDYEGPHSLCDCRLESPA